MPFRKISRDLKDITIELWDVGWALSDICQILHVSCASLYRWDDLVRRFGQTTNPNPALVGRERIVSLAVLSAIRTVFDHDATVMLDELQWHRAIHHDVAISISALQATLQRAGLTRKRLRHLAAEHDDASRVEYRDLIHNPDFFSGTGAEFVTVDESSKDEQTLTHRYGRSQAGTAAEASAPFVRGDRYTLTAAMSIKGYVAVRVVEDSMDAFEFFDFIVQDVLPEMNRYPRTPECTHPRQLLHPP
ncbi:hypothetical protein C8F01DRAFT_1267000 [Mycena amicta]|nr:hypothetical protein C8F01DRAFT_1267000 [Mycena amicta]